MPTQPKARKPDLGSLGIFLGAGLSVLLFVVAENEPTLNWWQSAIGYAVCLILISWSVLTHGIPHKGALIRYGSLAAMIASIGWLSIHMVAKQYEKDVEAETMSELDMHILAITKCDLAKKDGFHELAYVLNNISTKNLTAENVHSTLGITFRKDVTLSGPPRIQLNDRASDPIEIAPNRWISADFDVEDGVWESVGAAQFLNTGDADLVITTTYNVGKTHHFIYVLRAGYDKWHKDALVILSNTFEKIDNSH